MPRPLRPRKPASARRGTRPPRPVAASPIAAFGLRQGDAVILYLREPKEKVWGLMVSLGISGIVVRCIVLASFDDWMRQEARGDEPYLGLTTVFYPMNRVERMERDETLGPVISWSDRFLREVGRPVHEVVGIRRDSGGAKDALA